MRILFMADVRPNVDSGAAGTEVRTIEALRAQGHEVQAIWSPDLGRRIGHGNLHYLLELPRAYRRALADASRTQTYDVVHVNQPHGFLAARHLRSLPEGPVFVHRSHGFEMHVQEEVGRWKRVLGGAPPTSARTMASWMMSRLLNQHSKAIARWADGHIVSSSLDAEFLNRRLSVPLDRIAVIAQAPPSAFFDSPPPPMTDSRLRKVLYVGQFEFVKAPMIVAGVMRALAGDPSVQLTWVTAARDHHRVRELMGSTAGRVDLVDWRSADELQRVYDAHGVFLFPSFFEGFGKAFIEAMSRGLCVVASDVGGAHDVITSGQDGFLVPAGDQETSIAIVRSIIANPETSRAVSRSAIQTASRYNWPRVAMETADFYSRLIDFKNAGSVRT